MTKPAVYAPIPEFDQVTQYVVQLEPVEMLDHFFVGVEVRNLPPQDSPLNHEGWSDKQCLI